MNKFNRGPELVIKARSKDEFDLVAFRHMEFRKVDNPDPTRLKYYEPTIASASAAFLRRCKNLCMDSMIELDDLKSYAYVWTCNYIGLYQLPDDSNDQNIKLLRTYLSQRFYELRKLLWKKGKNIFVHYDEAHIAFCGTPYDLQKDYTYKGEPEDGSNSNWFSTVPEKEEVDQSYIIRHRGYESSSVEKRQTLAAKALETGLNNLGHDRMVEILNEAKDNLRIHPDAQKHAVEKLKTHVEVCEKCKSLSVEENKQMPGINQRSV